ncbi:MAG: FAD-dependent oxidoreductase [Gammaproteobacteria bacterium]|nr:FAD-dependent oxidoreductase [Gammaproteobacteria bacterium]
MSGVTCVQPTSLPDQQTEALVVGSGASGLTAALTAADQGAKVLIIEKGHLFGGTSATSGGTIWIPNNHLIGPAGGSDSAEDAERYITALAEGFSSPQRIRAFVEYAPRMFRWLDEKTDVKFESLTKYCDYHPELPGGRSGFRSCQALPIDCDVLGGEFEMLQPPHVGTTAFGCINWTAREAHPLITQSKGAKQIFLKIAAKYYLDVRQRWKTSRDRRLTGGGALVARLRWSLRKRKVPMQLSTELTGFIVENGRVVGAQVLNNGIPQRIHASRGVILASGGFERNAELRTRHLPGPTTTAWSAGNPFNTGSATIAAMQLGAKMANLDSAWWAPGYKLADEDRARPMFVERSLPGSIMVDGAGRRFCNEAASYHVTGGLMARGYRASDGGTVPSWFIFDGRYRGKYALGPIFPGPPSFDRSIRPSMRAILRSAASIGELAQQIGVPADNLQATIERFNAQATTGKDEDFARGESLYDRYYGDPAVTPNCCLAPLAKAPFYAIPIQPCDIGTNGGIVTDEHARALNVDGVPIPGLYATGNCSASSMGKSYPAAGATLGSGMTFGYLAALHATAHAAGESA